MDAVGKTAPAGAAAPVTIIPNSKFQIPNSKPIIYQWEDKYL